MGKIEIGILGGFRGKVGTVVGSFWKGKPVMRAYVYRPQSIGSNAQQLIRTRFGACGKFAALLTSVLNRGLKNYANSKKITPDNAFVKLNWSMVTASIPGTATIDYTGVQIAKGPLTGVTFDEPGFDNPLEVTVDWTPNTEAEDTDANDLVYIVLYSPDLNATLQAAGIKRSVGTAALTVPNSWNGQRVYIWGYTLGAGAKNEGKVSNSAYIGSGNIS